MRALSAYDETVTHSNEGQITVERHHAIYTNFQGRYGIIITLPIAVEGLYSLEVDCSYQCKIRAINLKKKSYPGSLSCLVLSYVLANTPMESNGQGWGAWSSLVEMCYLGSIRDLLHSKPTKKSTPPRALSFILTDRETRRIAMA